MELPPTPTIFIQPSKQPTPLKSWRIAISSFRLWSFVALIYHSTIPAINSTIHIQTWPFFPLSSKPNNNVWVVDSTLHNHWPNLVMPHVSHTVPSTTTTKHHYAAPLIMVDFVHFLQVLSGYLIASCVWCCFTKKKKANSLLQPPFRFSFSWAFIFSSSHNP